MWHRNTIANMLHPVYRRVIGPLRRSRLAARWVFGVRRFPRRNVCYWDWVTLALRRVLRCEPLQDRRFLDVGCGFAAILSIYVHKRGCTSITAIDIVPDCVRSARRFLEANNVPAVLKLSDMASALSGERFDVIAFNSTYIPEAWGKAQQLDRGLRTSVEAATSTWSGGEDGTRSIRQFVREMPPLLARDGILLLGFNRFYVEVETVRHIVRKAGLKLEAVVTFRIGSPVVFSLHSPSQELNDA